MLLLHNEAFFCIAKVTANRDIQLQKFRFFVSGSVLPRLPLDSAAIIYKKKIRLREPVPPKHPGENFCTEHECWSVYPQLCKISTS